MASRSTNVSARTSAPPGRWAVGRAFRVEDAMLALRWAELVRERGYRLSFSHAFAEADEAIQIHRVPQRRPIATVFLGVNWVWSIDRAGRATPHDDLAAALAALVDLSDADWHALRAPCHPAWLPRFDPAGSARPAPSWLTPWRRWRRHG